MSYTTTFTLKQHTPIIHFQHEQEGATLRATELKPALDRLILSKAYNNEFEAAKTLLVGYSQKNERRVKQAFDNYIRPLDYKVVIKPGRLLMNHEIETTSKRKDGSSRTNNFPGFFGHTGKDLRKTEELSRFILHENLGVAFISPHEKIIALIKEYFELFLARNNFGMRKSKGFGSFFIDEKHDAVTEYFNYHFDVNISNNKPIYSHNSYFTLFRAINLFYSAIRSGINNPSNNLYFKSLMFQYAKEETKECPLSIQWDKKAIKDFFPGDKKDTAKEARLMRDMLGLSSEQDWVKSGDTISKKSDLKINDKPGIARFASPVFFKVIQLNKQNFRVYLDTKKIPPIYFEQKFLISSKKYRNKGILELDLPSNQEFDLHDFLEFCVDYFHNEGHFDKYIDYNDSTDARILRNIFLQLKAKKA